MSKLRVWILAAGPDEAEAVAREGGLHPTEWRMVTADGIRGFQGAEIWETPCWWHRLNLVTERRIRGSVEVAVLHGGTIVPKSCPARSPATPHAEP